MRCRGAARAAGRVSIYLPDEPCERVYVILAYAKGTMDSLTRAQENELRKLTQELAGEDC
jgi:hypothetical protein